MHPYRLTRPNVGRSPVAPHRLLGEMILPRVSLPIADPDGPIDLNRTPTWTESNQPDRPDDDEKLAYLTVAQLGKLIKSKQVSSLELTKLYLARLKKYNEILNCVVTLTEDLAIRQAKQADAEIAAGRYRGPLHGIPWGAKDLISVPGYATTWGGPSI